MSARGRQVATMRAVLRMAIVCAGLGAATGSRLEASEQATSAPFEMMRALEILQDQVAAGNAIAQVGSVKMINRMATRFSSVDPAVWKDKRNARALVLYLFGGGNSSAIETAITKQEVAEGYATLFEGALAYGLGDDKKARTILTAIDARNLPSGLGGHLALVQATLIANTDKPKALQLLDLARLLEPGTLVEEAALRKEMFLIGASGDIDKFALLARRYVHGFSKSVYAENFRQLQIRTAIEVAKAGDAAGNSRLDTLLNGIEPHDRRSIYLVVAQTALIEGRLNTARFAAEAAIKMETKPDADAMRAKVYFGASTITTSDYELGLAALRSADPEQLPAKDAGIRASALEIASMIRGRASILDATGANTVTGGDASGVEKTLSDANRSLAASNSLLARSLQ